MEFRYEVLEKEEKEKEAVEISKCDLLANAKYDPFNNLSGQVMV